MVVVVLPDLELRDDAVEQLKGRLAEQREDEDERCGDEAEDYGVLGHRLTVLPPDDAETDVPSTSLRATLADVSERVDVRYEGNARRLLSPRVKDHPKGVGRYAVRMAALRTADGTVVCARCEVASSHWRRFVGLMGRSSLAPDEGMLFPRTGSIHMFFMRFPIDAVFCDRDLRVVKVSRDLKPWRTAAARAAKVVIELAAGAADGIEPGDRLELAE